jgi:hypothetical protein
MTSKKPAKKSTRKPTKKVVTASLVELTPVSGYVEPVAAEIVDEPKNQELVADVLDTAPTTPPKTRWQQWCEWWDK